MISGMWSAVFNCRAFANLASAGHAAPTGQPKMVNHRIIHGSACGEFFK